MYFPVYKTEINDRGIPLRWPRDSLYPQKLALTLPTSCGRSVGIVRSRTKTTEFSFSLFVYSLFNDASSSLDYISSIRETIYEQWIRKDLKGNGSILI
jgi:hypothetical protein